MAQGSASSTRKPSSWVCASWWWIALTVGVRNWCRRRRQWSSSQPRGEIRGCFSSRDPKAMVGLYHKWLTNWMILGPSYWEIPKWLDPELIAVAPGVRLNFLAGFRCQQVRWVVLWVSRKDLSHDSNITNHNNQPPNQATKHPSNWERWGRHDAVILGGWIRGQRLPLGASWAVFMLMTN